MKNYIRFDWAMKRMLRNKASFVILEGFLTTLLERKIIIKELLDSESNAEEEYSKTNRVDILAEDEDGKLILIEVQNNAETSYFQRILFGTSKLITQYMQRGQGYDKVRKVYSINIIYFPLGSGNDTVYHGRTEFRGIHTGELLKLSPLQAKTFGGSMPADLYPEYYILKVNDFNKFSLVPLDQWIYFLNTSCIPDEANAPGLPEARQQLVVDNMSKENLEAYYRHLDDAVILRDNIETVRNEGRREGLAEGRQEGLSEGRQEERRANALKMKQKGIPLDVIAEITGMEENEIMQLQQESPENAG